MTEPQMHISAMTNARKWLRPATGGATPIGDRARPRQIGASTVKESVTTKPKSVTYVLDHECYLCPDPRPHARQSFIQQSIHPFIRLRFGCGSAAKPPWLNPAFDRGRVLTLRDSAFLTVLFHVFPKTFTTR
jgi:hypothetical protein